MNPIMGLICVSAVYCGHIWRSVSGNFDKYAGDTFIHSHVF